MLSPTIAAAANAFQTGFICISSLLWHTVSYGPAEWPDSSVVRGRNERSALAACPQLLQPDHRASAYCRERLGREPAWRRLILVLVQTVGARPRGEVRRHHASERAFHRAEPVFAASRI